MIEHLKQTKAGFTLVELIVVIAILAILSGIAIPVYSGYISKANEAADLQLLSAVNTAWAAACADRGLDPTRVVGLATLSGDPGNKTISNITANGSGAVALSGGGESFNDAFLRYYGDNINTPFKVYNSLGYDMANGVFVDGATEVTVMYNGKPVTVTMEQITSYQASTFGEMGSDAVLDEVNLVVNAAKLSLSQLSNPNNPAYAEFRAELESFLQENYGIGLAGLNDVQRANALVLMVASKTKNMNAADLVREFNETGRMDSILPSLDASTMLSGMATSTTIPYALAMAYANSDYASDMHLTTRTETIGKKQISAADAAGWTQEQADTFAQQWALENGYSGYDISAKIASSGKVTFYARENVDYSVNIKDLFYNGYDFSRLPVNIGGTNYNKVLAGANTMSNSEDVENLTGLILSSDGFNAYMQSGQGEQDLNAFFSAMTMLSDNAGNIDTNDLLTNGFGDESLQAMVAAILGG